MTTANTDPGVIKACWKQTGVWGDHSCRELAGHVHCRNCRVFGEAAARLLNREAPAGYLEEWSARIAGRTRERMLGAVSILVFRLAGEWLGLPTGIFLEVAETRTIHSLPHRKEGIVRGIVSVRGEVVTCISLHELLGLSSDEKPRRESHSSAVPRLLVASKDGNRVCFPVEEVFGTHRYHPAEIMPAPSTVALATSRFSLGLISWKDHHVGLLDDGLLFYSVGKHLI